MTWYWLIPTYLAGLVSGVGAILWSVDESDLGEYPSREEIARRRKALDRELARQARRADEAGV